MSDNARAIRIFAETLRSIAFGSISGSYAAIGGALANPSRILKITNTTDADMIISYDGTNNHEIVPTASAVVFDFCSNQTFQNGAFLAEGTIIYVKQVSAPSKGSVYVSTYYGLTP